MGHFLEGTFSIEQCTSFALILSYSASTASYLSHIDIVLLRDSFGIEKAYYFEVYSWYLTDIHTDTHRHIHTDDSPTHRMHHLGLKMNSSST